MRVDELLAPIVLTIRAAHKARTRDASPGLTAALDQDHTYFKEMVAQTGIKPRDFTAHDVYLMMWVVGLGWSIAQRALDHGTIDQRQYEAAVMVTSTSGYGILRTLCPAWLDSDSETAL